MVNHRRFCLKPDCLCDLISKNMVTASSNSVKQKGVQRYLSSFTSLSSDDVSKAKVKEVTSFDMKRNFSEFALNEIEHFHEYNKKDAKLYLLKGLICDEMQNKKSKSLFELMKAEECSPNLVTQFQIFCLRTKIKAEILQDEIKKDTTSKSSMPRIVKYYELLMVLQELLIYSVAKYEHFWEEVKATNPNFSKFLSYITTIASTNELIKSNIYNIQSFSPSDIKATMLYSLYLKIIEEDYSAASEQHNKYKSKSSIGKSSYDDIENKYGAGSYTAVIQVSGNKSDIGTVINCNHEVSEVMGYTKDEIINKNIEKLMPDIIGSSHNKLIEKFYDNDIAKLKIAYVEKLVISQHKKGYIVPILLSIRMMPSHDSNVTFMAFLKIARVLGELRTGDENIQVGEAYIFLLSPDNLLIGFNMEIASLISANIDTLDINRYTKKQQKLDICAFFDQLFSIENENKMISQNGLFIELDMFPLKDAIEKIIKDTSMQDEGSYSILINNHKYSHK